MTGLHYVTDDLVTPTVVMLDLQQWRELWKNIYDGIVAGRRKDGPLVPWKEVKRQLTENRGLPN